jgi:hypothetical protein
LASHCPNCTKVEVCAVGAHGVTDGVPAEADVVAATIEAVGAITSGVHFLPEEESHAYQR